mmetsp:Transcript_99575/g.286039  ORF Transcript_99575/g.286039 Transcript_99575/m.286039 type:complete len:353 (-) Transcript_99575:253-1311(-)
MLSAESPPGATPASERFWPPPPPIAGAFWPVAKGSRPPPRTPKVVSTSPPPAPAPHCGGDCCWYAGGAGPELTRVVSSIIPPSLATFDGCCGWLRLSTSCMRWSCSACWRCRSCKRCADKGSCIRMGERPPVGETLCCGFVGFGGGDAARSAGIGGMEFHAGAPWPGASCRPMAVKFPGGSVAPGVGGWARPGMGRPSGGTSERPMNCSWYCGGDCGEPWPSGPDQGCCCCCCPCMHCCRCCWSNDASLANGCCCCPGCCWYPHCGGGPGLSDCHGAVTPEVPKAGEPCPGSIAGGWLKVPGGAPPYLSWILAMRSRKSRSASVNANRVNSANVASEMARSPGPKYSPSTAR